MSSHKKKRNSALLFEFLTRKVSQSLIDGDKRGSTVALKLIKRHFKPGTELHNEFRLANALLKTTVSSEAVASSILGEAKVQARSFNAQELDHQKSLLIKNINHAFGGDDFYDQQVNEFRTMATIQTLINDWRSPSPDLGRLAQYEDQLVKWLTSDKQLIDEALAPEDSPGSARLLMKVLTKKLNDKWSGVLTEGQRELVKAYAFSLASDEGKSICMKLTETREDLLIAIQSHLDLNSKQTFVNEKLERAKQDLLAEDVSKADDAIVSRFMLYAKLCDELKSPSSEDI